MGDSDVGLGQGNVGGTVYTPVTPDQTTQVDGAQVINGQVGDSTSSGSTSTSSKGTGKTSASNPQLKVPNDNLVDHDLSHSVSAPPELPPKTNGDGKTPPSAEEVNRAYDQAFDKAVEGKPDENALRFAHYNSAPGTPMTALEKEAFEQIAAKFGVTSQEFTPTPVKKDFMEEMACVNDDEFASLLQNQKPPLSKGDIAKLKSLHYNPNTTFKGSDEPKLQAQLKSLEKQATATTVTKYGIPLNSDGTPKMPIEANSKGYNAMLNGFYQKFVDTNTTEFLNSPVGIEMSASDKQSLVAFIKDPTVAVSDTVKAAATQIIAQSTAQVIANQNLEGVGFTPAPAGTYPAVPPLIKNFINMVNGVMSTLQNVVNALPSKGPGGALKLEYQNILATISAALQRFEETVYASQTTSSSKAKENSDAKLGMALDQIKKNGVQAADAKKQAQKMESMSKWGALIMAIVTVIMVLIAIIVTICTLGAAGPEMFALTCVVVGAVTGAVAGAVTAGVAVGTTEGIVAGVIAAVEALIEVIVEAVVNALENILQQVISSVVKFLVQNTIREAIKDVLKTITDTSLKSIVKAITEAVVDAIKSLMQNVQEVYTALKDISIDTIKEAVSNAVKGALQGLEDGMDTLSSFEKFSDKVVEMVKDVVQGIADNSNILIQTGEVIQGAGDVAQGGIQIGQSMIQAHLALMRADSDADKTLTDGELKNLSKLIQQLLALLSGQSDLIEYIGTTQTGMTKKASQTITAITAA